MRNWKRRANLGYAEARKQSRQEVMHLLAGPVSRRASRAGEKHEQHEGD
jgi:hypothetical protein